MVFVKSGVPRPIAVTVKEQAYVVFAGIDEEEVCPPVGPTRLTHHGVLPVKQLHDNCGVSLGHFHKQGGILFESPHLDALLHLVRIKPVPAGESHGIHSECVLCPRMPLCQQFVRTELAGFLTKDKRSVHLHRVDSLCQMDESRIYRRQRLVKGEIYVLVKLQCGRHFRGHLKKLDGRCRVDRYRVILLATTQLALEFFLPLCQLVRLLLGYLLAGRTGCHLQRISLKYEAIECVRSHIGHTHPQRVDVIDQRIFYPIVDGVILGRMLHDKRIRGVEIHPFDARQRISRCREVERELMGHRTFLLHHILCRRLFGKRPEHDVVRHEVSVFH